MFSPKDFIPDSLKSLVVYQFTCASCGVRYIGETNRHFNTRMYVCMYVCKSLFKHGKSSVKLKLKTKTIYNCFT